jgi:hypothetical protein
MVAATTENEFDQLRTHPRLWTSKLGDWEDIEHDTWQSLEGGFYGHVAVFMRRRYLA